MTNIYWGICGIEPHQKLYLATDVSLMPSVPWVRTGQWEDGENTIPSYAYTSLDGIDEAYILGDLWVHSWKYMFRNMYNLRVIHGLNHLWNIGGEGYIPGTAESAFENCSSLQTLDLSHLVVINMRNMTNMFARCVNLREIKLGTWRTFSPINMSYMFAGCTNLMTISIEPVFVDGELQPLIASNTAHMFDGCKWLKFINMSLFDVSNVDNMIGMFSGCENLTTLDLSHFNTSNLVYANSMFSGCKRLQKIFIGENWDTSSVEVSQDMFHNCINIIGFCNTTYDANHKDITYARADGGEDSPGYLTFDAGEPDTTLYFGYYEGSHALWISNDPENFPAAPDASGAWDVGDPENPISRDGLDYSQLLAIETVVIPNAIYPVNMWGLFADMENLERFATDNTYPPVVYSGLRNIHTVHTKNMADMFYFCKKLSMVSFSSNNHIMVNVRDIDSLFEGCTNLQYVEMHGLCMSSLSSVHKMFYGCDHLTNVSFAMTSVPAPCDMDYMFSGCTSLTYLDISGFDAPRLPLIYTPKGNMRELRSWGMFSGCENLCTIYANDSWKLAISANERETEMFSGCTQLIGGNGTTYDEDHIKSDYAHVDGGVGNPGYFTSVQPTPATVTVTVLKRGAGYITPAGEIQVPVGGDITVYFIPDIYAHIRDIRIAGESYGALSSVTVSNVQKDMLIYAIFEDEETPGFDIKVVENRHGIYPNKLPIAHTGKWGIW